MNCHIKFAVVLSHECFNFYLYFFVGLFCHCLLTPESVNARLTPVHSLNLNKMPLMGTTVCFCNFCEISQ